MKTVFNDQSAVAHMWANKQQECAKYSGGNFYYDGDTIYSYGSHFPIARHIEHNGEKAVLFTLKTYSNTTAKHIHIVRQACRHLDIIYCEKPELNQHEGNFKYWIAEGDGILNKLKTARKPEKYLCELRDISYKVHIYANFFDIKVPPILESMLLVADKNQCAEYELKKTALLEAELKKKEQEDKKKHKKALKDWEAGRTSRLYIHDGYDYLRPDLDRGFVQTSQGVNIPMAFAEKFYEKIKDNSLQIGSPVIDIHGHVYTVSAVGDIIKIGCHTFKKDYILKFGKKLFADKVV
jgi:hypothetical protein